MSAIAIPTPPALITPDDLLRMPDAQSYELVDGKLLERNVSVESSRVGLEIGRLLGNEAIRTNLAIVYGSDLGYQCFADDPRKIRKPDCSVVRKNRLAALEGDAGFMHIPADLAVEVISPNDLYYEVDEKVQEYLDAGFGAVWIANPNLKTIRIERRDSPSVLLHEDDEITGEPALPEFRCRVGDFFKR
jgi:Uma2 family endonuclease